MDKKYSITLIYPNKEEALANKKALEYLNQSGDVIVGEVKSYYTDPVWIKKIEDMIDRNSSAVIVLIVITAWLIYGAYITWKLISH